MHDEVERRYVHAVWMRSTENKSSLRESSLPVPFLPVNTAYPPLRQQVVLFNHNNVQTNPVSNSS